MSGIPFPQKVWTGAHEWTAFSSSVHSGGTRSPASQPVGVPTPRPPPPASLQGQQWDTSVSLWSCFPLCMWQVRLHLRLATSPSKVQALQPVIFSHCCSHPCPAVPQHPSGQTQRLSSALGPLRHRPSARLCSGGCCGLLCGSAFYQVMQNTSAVPFCREAAWASRVSPSWEAMNPSQHFPNDCWKPQSWPPCLQEGPTGGAAGATGRHPRGAGRLPPPPRRGPFEPCPGSSFHSPAPESAASNPMPESLCVSSTSGDSKVPFPIKSQSSKTSL